MTLLPAILSNNGTVHYNWQFFLAWLFYYLEVKFIPQRKEKLVNKIIDIFDAYPVKENITRFKNGNLSIYTEIKLQLLLIEHQSYIETIQFNVSQVQIDTKGIEPSTSLKKGNCNGVETYIVYESSGWGLKRTKRKLEKRLANYCICPKLMFIQRMLHFLFRHIVKLPNDCCLSDEINNTKVYNVSTWQIGNPYPTMKYD